MRKNPRSKRARRQQKADRSERHARELPRKIAKRRVAIKRQLRRAGAPTGPNGLTRMLRATRRAMAARPGYQIAAYSFSSGKIAFWDGHGFTMLRGDAASYASPKIALEVARNLRGYGKLAVASSTADPRDIFNRLQGASRRGKQ